MLDKNLIYQGDCLEIMRQIDDRSIDMILCDLPYQETECNWDKQLDISKLWIEYKRIIKPKAAILLFGSFKFSITLYNSCPELFKYELVWDKVKPSNIFVGKLRPLNKHEYINVFSYGTVANKSPNLMNYYPIMEDQKPRKSKMYSQSDLRYRENLKSIETIRDKKYPKSILTFSNANQNKIHPTQKPIDLCEYLIKTYTNEGELVLDNCMGSGTTALAALKCNREFIGIEKETKYVQLANQRIQVFLRDGIIK